MAAPIRFESSRQKEAERNELRKAREVVLENAKKKYEKEEKKREEAKLRGEDTWMLPSVTARLEQENENEEKAKKRKKKEKKKKKKKEKKKKKHSKNSDTSSGSEDEPEWVEKSSNQSIRHKEEEKIAVKGPTLQRESWMEAPLDLIPTITRDDIRERIEQDKKEKQVQKNLLDQPGQHARELNPYWKDGGTGLPEAKKSSSKVSSASLVGDGGLEWMRKAYDRAVEQAKAENRSLEDVAAEKYGSLEKLKKMLENAEKANRKVSIETRASDSKSRFRKPDDSDEERPRMQSARDRKRDRSRSPDRERHRTRRSRSRSKDGDRKRDYKKTFMRPRSRSRSQSRERTSSNRRRSRSKSVEKKRKTFQRPNSDSDDEESHYSSRSKDYERSSQGHSRQRYRRSRSRSRSRERLRNRFMRPSDSPSNDKDRRRGHEHQKVPAWKKREGRSQREATHVKTPASHSSSSSSSDGDSESQTSASESSEEQEPVPSQPRVKILTEEEMNAIGAKILRAELMSNNDLAAKLKAQLEESRVAREKMLSAAPSSKTQEKEEKEEVIVLTHTNKAGMVRPVDDVSAPDSSGRRRRKKQKMETHSASGERMRYFEDDDNHDLKKLVEMEKMGTQEANDLMFAKLYNKSVGQSEDYEIDDAYVDKAAEKKSKHMDSAQNRQKAIGEHQKMKKAVERCQLCFENVQKHLIVAIGTKAFLSLPAHKSLTDGHCLIAPIQHSTSSLTLDEDVFAEIQVFRQALCKMFADQDETVIFMETNMFQKSLPHMVVECVPIPNDTGMMAPIYFKKAIQESGSEWSDNKKLVELGDKTIRRAIPKGFPFFSVDFGMKGGFAHVIENEHTFPKYFGREIVGGMLDADPSLWRKPFKENFDSQRRKVLQFAEWWKPFDFTQSS